MLFCMGILEKYMKEYFIILLSLSGMMELQPVSLGRAFLYFFELPVKKGDAFKTSTVTDFAYLLVCFNQQFTSPVNPVFI